jgi:hypothetical protein
LGIYFEASSLGVLELNSKNLRLKDSKEIRWPILKRGAFAMATKIGWSFAVLASVLANAI